MTSCRRNEAALPHAMGVGHGAIHDFPVAMALRRHDRVDCRRAFSVVERAMAEVRGYNAIYPADIAILQGNTAVFRMSFGLCGLTSPIYTVSSHFSGCDPRFAP